MLGQHLEFSVHTPDILDSLGFYKALGFTELETGDIWTHRYAVVSDGKLCIGLHDRVFDAPALTFVHQDLARHARAMADHGFDFSFLRIDEDVFNELGFADCNGHMITLIEARTFSAMPDDLENSSCGRWFELTLPVRDTVRAGRFWAPLAPTLLQLREEPVTHMRFDAGGLPLGLNESPGLKGPALCFRCQDKPGLNTVLERHGMKSENDPRFEGAFKVITAPEGTAIYLFDEDFLEEAVVVDDNGD